MKRTRCVFVILFVISVLAGAKTVPLPDLTNPEEFRVHGDQMYITEKTTVFIYSLKDYRLKKKFGKKGQGPREFFLVPPVPLTINFDGDDLIITSEMKVSRFSKDGVFKEEMKPAVSNVYYLKSLGKQFAGCGLYSEKDKIYRAVNIYDAKLKKVKEVYRIIHDFQMRGKGFYTLLPYAFASYGNKIFIPWKSEFCIDVYDDKGQFLYSIKQDYKNLEVTEAHKEAVLETYKIDPKMKIYYERFLKPVYFPEYFYAVRDIRVTAGRVYAFTYKDNNDKSECFIFDIKGKLLKKTVVSLEEKDPSELYPFDVSSGKFYQLLENEKTEGWELNIVELH